MGRDHHIPFTRHQIINMLDDELRSGSGVSPNMPGPIGKGKSSKKVGKAETAAKDGPGKAATSGKRDCPQFKKLGTLLASYLHFKYLTRLENLKELYGQFNPDEDTGKARGKESSKMKLEKELLGILTDANYVEISKEDIRASVDGEGLFPISCEVDFDAIKDYRMFYQGERMDRTTLKKYFGKFGKKEVEFDVYNRLVVLMEFKSQAYFEKREKARFLGGLRFKLFHLKPPGKEGKLYFKMLKNVPKADMEIVFPNPQPKMKLTHQLKIAIPLLGGIGILAKQFVVDPLFLGKTDVLAGGSNKFLLGVVVGLGGYMYKTYQGYQQTVQEFLNEITHSLYFKSIVNNSGVFSSLVDLAEEEESKELLVAYAFLARRTAPATEKELDAEIEAWFRDKHATRIDFECNDALGDLVNLGLARNKGDGYTACNCHEALELIDGLWDSAFTP